MINQQAPEMKNLNNQNETNNAKNSVNKFIKKKTLTGINKHGADNELRDQIPQI